jgi:clan AA aspartic protease
VITGTVVANRGPVVPLVVSDASGREHALSAIVDTGFTGWLTLPKEMIASLGLMWRDETLALLADGSATVFNAFRGTVIWDGQPKAVFIGELDSEPLIGMRLLHGFRPVIETIDGGPVRIEGM